MSTQTSSTYSLQEYTWQHLYNIKLRSADPSLIYIASTRLDGKHVERNGKEIICPICTSSNAVDSANSEVLPSSMLQLLCSC